MPPPIPHPSYIWQHRAWPQFAFDAAALAPALERARLEQGRLLGLLGAIGLEQAKGRAAGALVARGAGYGCH